MPDSDLVRSIFNRIAFRYDLLNSLQTWGQDRLWRDALLRRLKVMPGGQVLDVGTGTGDLAMAISATHLVTALDFSNKMLACARAKKGSHNVTWVQADALCLPFPDSTFDAVMSGWFIRNAADIPLAFSEQLRVLKPGGVLLCLDTCSDGYHKSTLVRWYMETIIPALGKIVAKEAVAYEYLKDTTKNFHSASALANLLRGSGALRVKAKTYFFGTIQIIRGHKNG